MRSRGLALASLHLVLPALVVAAGAWFSGYRTPILFWVDPDYAYLLNALSIDELAAPTHTQHPGMPAQELGAVLMISAHTLHPAGFASTREHVLARPEPFLRLWRWVDLGLCAAALLAGGLFVWKTTGSPAAGVLFQLTPLLSTATLFSLSRVQAEPLALALGTGAGAIIVALASDAARWETRRTTAVLGAFAGLGLATKVIFAPFLLVCLVVLSGRSRRLFGAAAAAVCGLALIPAYPTLLDNARWYRELIVHTGYYGGGRPGLVDLDTFPGNLRLLLWEEWAAFALGLMGFGLGLALARATPADPSRKGAARALLASGLAQVAWLCIVAKHARVRYLLPVVPLAGISLALAWHACRGLRVAAAVRAAMIAVAVLGLCGQPWRLAAQAGDLRQEKNLRSRAAAIVAAGAGRIIEATPFVSQAGALRYGQIYSPARFGADLRRLHPGVTAWDQVSGINAFGWPADPARVMTPLPDGGASFRMMGVTGYPVVDSPPPGVMLDPAESLGRHVLYHGRILPCAGAADAPFAGFFDSYGLRWTAQPEPHYLGSSPTRLLFTGNGRPMTLTLQVRPYGVANEPLRISVNGQARVERTLADGFQDLSVSFQPRPGVNEAFLEYGTAAPAEAFVPMLAFRRLHVRCEGGG